MMAKKPRWDVVLASLLLATALALVGLSLLNEWVESRAEQGAKRLNAIEGMK